jgi:hypothetical protein
MVFSLHDPSDGRTFADSPFFFDRRDIGFAQPADSVVQVSGEAGYWLIGCWEMRASCHLNADED